MADEIKKCVVISGAPEKDISYYGRYAQGRYIICADSGYKKCLKAGLAPDLIIGDFDSSRRPDVDCEIIDLQVRKDDTDTFHCVNEAISRGYNDIVILGGIGSRVDHTYSNILAVNYCFDKGIKCELINSLNRIFIVQGEVVIEKGEYKYFSLFSLFDKCTVTITGAQYELDGYVLEPSSQLTQSNEFKDDKVVINAVGGKIILILCND